ncbi:hypothetical protein [Tellurirhabdus bombi]|uniref:hypothetical protein n=1 Tax=Tellurirhabdus bombi TaxID=2907205 RepID=UPI001F17FAC0|nr:hypothetical protein [Tellurirhabdus bombi]
MTKDDQSQVGFEQTVDLEEKMLTVEYWRDRFGKAAKHFRNMSEVAELLAEKDIDFAGPKGYIRLQSVRQNRASLIVTAKATRLLEQIIRDASEAS